MQNVIQTAWCVLTGAPSCGKTTVLKALESLGYTSVPEAARAYIEKSCPRDEFSKIFATMKEHFSIN